MYANIPQHPIPGQKSLGSNYISCIGSGQSGIFIETRVSGYRKPI